MFLNVSPCYTQNIIIEGQSAMFSWGTINQTLKAQTANAESIVWAFSVLNFL